MVRERTTKLCMKTQTLDALLRLLGAAIDTKRLDWSIGKFHKLIAHLRLDRHFLDQSNIHQVHTKYISSGLRRHQACKELLSNQIRDLTSWLIEARGCL